MKAKTFANIFKFFAAIVAIVGAISIIVLLVNGTDFGVLISSVISVVGSTLGCLAVSVVFDYLEDIYATVSSLSSFLHDSKDKIK